MLKKLLVGFFILGMLCGAGFSSAGQFSQARVTVGGDGETPAFSKVVCGGGNC